ncbi:MAG TPA: tryptophan 7-halogenase, partial [Woeseiaceae bacterium]|nr:tryptophan 7-halogenase [Woeseiaceae bacterium]
FRVGHRERAWAHNCIAIGLAGNCIEPLEATGLYLSDLASVMLTEHFPYRDDMEALAFRFNRIMLNRFYEILDFVNLHYCLTRRTDSDFWREVQRPERINDRLRAKLDYWRVKPPSPSDFEDQFLPGMPQARTGGNGTARDDRPPVDTADLFGIDSYEAVLYGMDFLREECDVWFGSNRPATQVARPIVERAAAALDKLPAHDVWLHEVLGAPQFAPGGRISR